MTSACVRIPYCGVDGQEVAVRFRLSLTGENRFKWRKGSAVCLYGLSRLNPKPQSIVLVEGESDCHTLWFHDIHALGAPGADNWKEERDAQLFDGIDCIYVIIEPDRGGETVKKWLAKSRIRDRVRLVHLGEHKDPSGLYLADPPHFQQQWQAALKASIPWADQAKAKAVAQRKQAWTLCKDLALHPRILDCFAEDLMRCGVAGEQRVGKLIYRALSSCHCERPVSIAVKGPSSGGKSYLTECVLSFSPPTAYYALSALSDRALAYSEEPLVHRFLVIYEAAGMQGDFATYLLRSLLSEGKIRYETVEKTRNGLKPKLIEREGPTGLLVTTTATRLHPENETRLLSLTVTDTPDQTHRILLALAEEHTTTVDRSRWHALQTWIEGGTHRVTIPYAKILAEKIPPLAVRLRRDFSTLLNLIRAHALLQQATRGKDSAGRIIASLDDYTVVRELVHDLMAEGIEATVPSTVRATMEAVKTLIGTTPEVSITRLSQELKIDKAATSRRVKSAIDRGFLQNLETKKRLPARLILGDPLPEERPILPLPEEVLTCCTIDGRDTSPPPPQSDNYEPNGFDWTTGTQSTAEDAEVLE